MPRSCLRSGHQFFTFLIPQLPSPTSLRCSAHKYKNLYSWKKKKRWRQYELLKSYTFDWDIQIRPGTLSWSLVCTYSWQKWSLCWDGLNSDTQMVPSLWRFRAKIFTFLMVPKWHAFSSNCVLIWVFPWTSDTWYNLISWALGAPSALWFQWIEPPQGSVVAVLSCWVG